MLNSAKNFNGYKIFATDGEVGKIEQFFFDDQSWTIRYLVVNTGTWLSEKKVLISPIAVRSVDLNQNSISVSLTRAQVEHSPDIDTEKPVSRQMEAQYYDYYQWPYYWSGSAIWGMGYYPSVLLNQPPARPEPDPNQVRLRKEAEREHDPHLRSSRAVKGYRVAALDQEFGTVDDFLFDDGSWSIRYLVVDTIRFWPSKHVVISPEWVSSISWSDRSFQVEMTEEQIKSSPEYRPDRLFSRDDETRLHEHYRRPGYWTQKPPGSGLSSAIREPGRHLL